jgi:hypothetical protein
LIQAEALDSSDLLIYCSLEVSDIDLQEAVTFAYYQIFFDPQAGQMIPLGHRSSTR